MPRMLDYFQLWYFWLCGHFVHEKFGTRYSGHLLSRLAGFLHNLTKQTRFPTTWRENGKSNSKQVNLWFICDVWLSTTTTFIILKLTANGGFCSLCLVGFKLGWEDWLILDRVMDTPVCRAILTWNGFWPGGSWESYALLAYQNSQARWRVCIEEGCGLLADG